jgi:hypothetical protein
MASTEVAVSTPSVPALVSTPSVEITAEDVLLSRIYIGQFMSSHVQEQQVKAGSIYTATGQDDGDPQILWEPGDKAEDAPVVHVLGLKKGKSLSVDGELELYDYDDPSAPAEAWVTYSFFVAIPGVDAEVPYKWLLTRTGTPAAKQINTVLAKNATKGPPWVSAFRITAAERKNPKGTYFVPRVSVVEASKESIAVAEQLAALISGQNSADTQATGEEPAI